MARRSTSTPQRLALNPVPAAEQSAVVPAGADPAAAGAAPDASAGATGTERAGTHPTRLQQASDTGIDGFNTLEWADLVAPGFTPEEIYERYQDQLESVESGSPEANELYATMQAEYDSGANVNAELDGLEIQLAGFVAPLSFDDDVLSEFLLVPYFGACIHVPPPPPNQTILVTFENVEDGLPLDDSWGPVWVAGKLTVDLAETDLATASYTLSGVTTRAYQGF